MTKDEIQHLGRLARIKLGEDEVVRFGDEITAILAYVSTVNEIAGEADLTKRTGAVFNVFRMDAVTNAADTYTDRLLAEMPETDGRYLKVKKILTQDD